MILAYAFWVLVLWAIAVICTRLYRQERAMRALQEQRVLHVNAADFRNLREAVMSSMEWRWDQPRHVCAARLTTAAHYIGGNRVVCPDCYGVMQGAA